MTIDTHKKDLNQMKIKLIDTVCHLVTATYVIAKGRRKLN